MDHRTAIHEDRHRTVLYLPNTEAVQHILTQLDAAHGALDKACSDGIVAHGEEHREMTLIEWAVVLAVIGIGAWSFAGLLGWR